MCVVRSNGLSADGVWQLGRGFLVERQTDGVTHGLVGAISGRQWRVVCGVSDSWPSERVAELKLHLNSRIVPYCGL